MCTVFYTRTCMCIHVLKSVRYKTEVANSQDSQENCQVRIYSKIRKEKNSLETVYSSQKTIRVYLAQV